MDHHDFRTKLKRFDPKLDLEFHPVKGCWQVVGTSLSGQKYVIYRIPLGRLGEYYQPVLDGLYACSPIRQGGAEAVERALAEADRRADDARERRLRDDLEYAALETYEHWQRREGERITTTGLPGAGYQILDRRAVRLEDVAPALEEAN